jgi:DNA polymerase
MGKEEKIKKLKERFIDFSKKYSLYNDKEKPVFGAGSLDSKIMFIGEAPGYNEALKGTPFCGASGKILDELLNSINLKREET